MEELRKENDKLKKEVLELKERLGKYTNPIFAKNYYENNKEKVLEKRALRYQKEKELKKILNEFKNKI